MENEMKIENKIISKQKNVPKNVLRPIELILLQKCTTNSIWLLENARKCQQHSSSTSAANSSSATGTSAPPTLKQFKFLSEKFSQSAAGDSMNTGSTCASVQGHIEQYVNELCSTPHEEDALSFWQKRHVHCLRHWQRTCCLSQYLRLMWSGSSLSVAGWHQDGETDLARQQRLEWHIFLKITFSLYWWHSNR